MKYGIKFPTDINNDGVFLKYKNFITYKCSSTSEGDCDNILGQTKKSNLWKSSDDKDAYFEVILQSGFFYPIDGVLLSCYDIDCIYNFRIMGKEKGDNEYKEICNVSKASDYFKGNLNLFSCEYPRPLNSFRILQNGKNRNNCFKMTIYYLDFYGFLSFGECSTKKGNNILFLCIISIFILVLA